MSRRTVRAAPEAWQSAAFGHPRHPHAGETWAGDAAGFTLFEVLLGLALMALVAALVLPGTSRPPGPTALRAEAYKISALLMNIRTAAVSGGRPASASVDREGRGIEGLGKRIDLPSGVTVALSDRRRPQIRFAPDGTSTGGAVLLTTASTRMTISVNAETGAIGFAP